MCLGELAEVLEVAAGSAVVRFAGRTAAVSLLTLDVTPEPGDWVLCHSGFALGRVTAEEAREAAGIRSGLGARPEPASADDGSGARPGDRSWG